MAAFNLSESWREQEFSPSYKSLHYRIIFHILIQIIFQLLITEEAQITWVAFGLSCAHKCQILLLPTDQTKAQKCPMSTDQIQSLNGGLVPWTDAFHLPRYPHPQAPRTRPKSVHQALSYRGPRRKGNGLGTLGKQISKSIPHLKPINPAPWLQSSRRNKCFTYTDSFNPYNYPIKKASPSSIHSWRKWGPERWSSLPKITQPKSGRHHWYKILCAISLSNKSFLITPCFQLSPTVTCIKNPHLRPGFGRHFHTLLSQISS